MVHYNNKYLRYQIEKQTKVKKLDSTLFTWDIWQAGSVHDFGIEHFRYNNLNQYKDKFFEGLEGYCFGEELSSKNVISKGNEEDSTKVNTTITSIEFVIVDGSTVVYVKTEDGVYKSEFNESLMLFDEGDEVSLSYFDTGASIEYIDSIK